MVWQNLEKLNIHLLDDPAVLLLSIYPADIKAYIHTPMITAKKKKKKELGLFMVLSRGKNVLQEYYTNMCDIV